MAASISPICVSVPLTQTRASTPSAFFNPLQIRTPRATPATKISEKFQVRASMKENLVTGVTAAAITASMVVPEMAQAAGGSLTPSLQNFLLSIGSGGAVLVAIIGAVVGISSFDPVERA